tara:strand:- start:5 stop:418 length:414 start_codon:yes stop_codon:yes gene_type:complete
MTEFGEKLLGLKEAEQPLLKRKDIKYLWHLSYYDGPISGVGMIGDEFCYFNMIHDCHFRRIFAVYHLSLDEFKDELLRHEMFRIHVGFHTDYHISGNNDQREVGLLQPGSEWKKFYDTKSDAKSTDYTDRVPVAYFR